jgi:hypothetical protein
MVGETKPEHPLHPHRPPLSRRQLLMQVVVAGVILASGVGIGTGGTILALKNRLVTRVRLLPPGPPGPEPNAIVEHWKGDYGLTDKQVQQARETLVKQFTNTRELRQKFMVAEQAEQEKFAAAMKKILNSEQYTKWEQDLKRRFEHFQRMRSFDGRGGGRGGPRGDRGPGRPKDPNDRRWDGPPRPPMEFDGRRGNWPPRGPMDPNSRHQGDRPPNRPPEPENRPGDVNGPR